MVAVTQYFVIKTQKEFLKFETSIVSDNIKNVIKYNDRTFLLYGLQGQGYVHPEKYFQKYPVYSAVYIEDSVFSDLAEETRRIALGEEDAL